MFKVNSNINKQTHYKVALLSHFSRIHNKTFIRLNLTYTKIILNFKTKIYLEELMDLISLILLPT